MANNHVGDLIQKARIRRSMTFGDLARACGAVTPKQTSRIAQRLVLFERESVRDRKLLQKVVAALDLDASNVVELLARQRVEELEEWNRWVDEPVPLELHMRPFAGVWISVPLPIEIAAEELRAIDYAKRLTIGRKEMRVVLAISRRIAYTFAHGQLVARKVATAPYQSLAPFVVIGGTRIEFVASS